MKKQTIENIVDYYNLESCGDCDVNQFYDDMETALNNNVPFVDKDTHKCPAVIYILKELLRMRFYDPASFDLVCMRIVFPDLTYEEMLDVLKGSAPDLAFSPVRKVCKDRARMTEALRTALERFPALKNIIHVDEEGKRKKVLTKDEALCEKIMVWVRKRYAGMGRVVILPWVVDKHVWGIENVDHCRKLLKMLKKSNKIKFDKEEECYFYLVPDVPDVTRTPKAK